MGIKHVSMYELTLHKGTPLQRQHVLEIMVMVAPPHWPLVDTDVTAPRCLCLMMTSCATCTTPLSPRLVQAGRTRAFVNVPDRWVRRDFRSTRLATFAPPATTDATTVPTGLAVTISALAPVDAVPFHWPFSS